MHMAFFYSALEVCVCEHEILNLGINNDQIQHFLNKPHILILM